MAFRDNTKLYSDAKKIQVADGAVDGTVYNGTSGADAFVIGDGAVGDALIRNFSSNDSIITGKKIFDGNGDGYIAFGPGSTLDVDRTSSRNAGNDNISILGEGNDRVTEIRFLGTKGGNFVYADSGTRDALFGHFTSGFTGTNTGGDSSVTQSLRIDNDVADNTYNFDGSVALLTDNALGLNFGSDTINGFGDDDLLIFTSKLYDSDGSGELTFGKNLVLDLSGSKGPKATDPTRGPGGQFDVTEHTAIYFIGEKVIDNTTYYYYGTESSTTTAASLHGDV